MRTTAQRWACVAILMLASVWLKAGVVYETYSAYHHILVVDRGSIRTLSFDGSMETKMSLANPLQGHFEYTEYFHMPWLWNTNIKRVLMIGLGGGSTQRSFLHYYTNVVIDSVEIDREVVSVAKNFFQVSPSPAHQIFNEDGRTFLRRSRATYDLVIMDAYTTTRYGSSIPPHLTTKEFFQMVTNRLSTNGVMAFNIIGQVRGLNGDFVGALHRTMSTAFPRVYMFPARESQNVVLVATRSPEAHDAARLRLTASTLVRQRKVRLPTFYSRLQSFMNTAPPSAAQSPVLTDDHAAVESLLR